MTTISIRVKDKELRKIEKLRGTEQKSSPYPISRHAFLRMAIMESVERRLQSPQKQ
jgi:hypothetical protein